MTRETQAIFKKALKLPLESKADLVDLLLNSILQRAGHMVLANDLRKALRAIFTR